jgi:hypothetical protein
MAGSLHIAVRLLAVQGECWGDVWWAFLKHATHVGHQLKIDGCTRRQPYLPGSSLDLLSLYWERTHV